MVWLTTPHAISLLMRQGEALARSYGRFSLRVAASGGPPLHAQAATWGQRAVGTAFVNCWWQPEAGAILVANQPDAIPPGAMGQPLPGIQIAVVQRSASGMITIAAPSVLGELAVKADLPSLFLGYARNDDSPSQALSDGWYLTGEYVRRDHNNVLWYAGRSEDLIQIQGQCHGPFELEAQMMDHPAVAEVAVVALNDSAPVAFVTLNPGFEPQQPLRQIHFIEIMPRTATGNILRQSLRRILADPQLLATCL